MITVPVVVPVVTSPVLLIVAIAGSDTLQATTCDHVKSCTTVSVPLVSHAVAANCRLVLTAMNGLAGDMAMEYGSVTRSVAELELLLAESVAVMMKVPVAPLASEEASP